MKIKSERGVTGLDVASGLIIFVISSAVVLSLYYQIYIISTQIKVHQAAIGCITEIFEKIDLENYDNITNTRIEEMIEESGMNEYFNKDKNDSYVQYSLTNYSEQIGASEDLIKKINITVVYQVGDHITTVPMNKIKVRE